MKLSRGITPVFAAIFGMSVLTAGAYAAPATGTWLSENGGTKVRISDCGGKLCGKVVWLKDPVGADGKPKTDRHNEDQAKRSRPLLGVPVVQGMAPAGENKWSGRIYNADDGKTYEAHVMVINANAMNVQGCVLSILCKSQKWTRAD
ncbi:MAG: DUF2147 domain-containing protein [Pseudolabrys sp.]|nr:DUF2147 domain-containing protein [Pseudolabrys sp.]MDP2294283.1 DUF2147 domain-containing protein [Pseudolabrys sp.]